MIMKDRANNTKMEKEIYKILVSQIVGKQVGGKVDRQIGKLVDDIGRWAGKQVAIIGRQVSKHKGRQAVTKLSKT